MTFFPSSEKEDILKNVGNQTVGNQAVAIDFLVWKKRKKKEFKGYRQLFGYQHSAKYLILCSTDLEHLDTGHIKLTGFHQP